MSTLYSFNESRITFPDRNESGTGIRERDSGAQTGFTTNIALSAETSLGDLSFFREAPERSERRTQWRQPMPKVRRRLQGFFIQEEGSEARVAFVEDGTLIHYYLPLALVKDGGVHAENQPFELDELETTWNDVVFIGYKVRASAPAGASRAMPLPLDADRQRKLSRILARRTDAQG